MLINTIVATLEGCSFAALDDADALESALLAAVAAGGFTLLHRYVHRFEPQGVTAAAVLAESHIALHSWPEQGVLFVDMATCSGAEATERAFAELARRYPHRRAQRQRWDYAKPVRRPSLPGGVVVSP